MPALRESLAAGMERPHLERALASWLHHLGTGRSDKGDALVISAPGAEALAACLRQTADDTDSANAALAHSPVFGSQPWPQSFVERLARHLSTLRHGGMTALLLTT